MTSQSRGRSDGGATADRILDVAERLVQTRGYNGFSYADVAGELGITRAALHYHFAGKAELGTALVARYTNRFEEALRKADADLADAPRRLDAYVQLYIEVLRRGRMCLCGMLAAEFQTLPKSMRTTVEDFFARNESWLTGVLESGLRDGSLRLDGSADEVARIVVGELEGAMLIARLHNDADGFEAAVGHLLGALRSPSIA